MSANTAQMKQDKEMSAAMKDLRRMGRVIVSRPGVTVGVFILLMVIICAVFARWISPFDPDKTNMAQVLVQPGVQGHLLGTDNLGRDIVSRLIFGAQTALIVGFICTFLSAIIGVTLGITAGYFGRWVSMGIMRVVDAVMAFPNVLLALLISSVLGGGIQNVIIALTVGAIAVYVRITNGLTLSLKENDYVLAGRAMGASNLRQMLTHIFPNLLAPIIVQMTLQLGFVVLAEAGLSFLGVGIAPPTSAWGSMVFQGYVYLETNPIISLAPGVAIMLVVFAVNMVGDGLRDALDPKLRGKI
jgi:ABC-type dipeptide/oligopeptide/nickel transport system permease subunit